MSTDIHASDRNDIPANADSVYSCFDSKAVLAWYDTKGRDLPWRRRWPAMAPAYHVFLSELMLQQTIVATAIPYFEKFTAIWPDIYALAQAELDDVLASWAGLGYYARARNMHKTARIIASEYDGIFPDTEKDLLALPGIGPYTAGAILSFAFDRPAIVIDGNIERILGRFGGITRPVAEIKPALKSAFLQILPDQRFSDFPQALMDLANDICQPRKPDCQHCPLQPNCIAAQADDPAAFPPRAAKKQKPLRTGTAYLISAPDGRFVMYRRPQAGLLGGMLSFPASGWDKSPAIDDTLAQIISDSPAKQAGLVTHIFTHFTAKIEVLHYLLDDNDSLPDGFFWAEDSPDDWPKLMQKIRAAAG